MKKNEFLAISLLLALIISIIVLTTNNTSNARSTDFNLFHTSNYLASFESERSSVYDQTLLKYNIDDFKSYRVIHDRFAYDKSFVYLFSDTKIPYSSIAERNSLEKIYIANVLSKTPETSHHLLNIDLERDNISVLTFNNEANSNEPFYLIYRINNTIYKNGQALGVDVDSFTPLNRYFSRDKDHIYLHGAPIDADLETFEVLDGMLARDKNYLYQFDQKISLQEKLIFDVPSLQPLNTLYYKDRFNVFIWAYDEFKRIPTADPQSFKIIGDFYAHDDQFAYFIDTIIKGADSKSFKAISAAFSGDKNFLYYRGIPLPGVTDTRNFKVFTTYVAMNQSQIYHQYKRLNLIDTTTFEHLKISPIKKSINNLTTLSDTTLSELYLTAFNQAISPQESPYFRDKANIYYLAHEARYLPDPEHQFNVITHELITDQKALYYQLQKIPANGIRLNNLQSISDHYFDDGSQIYFFNRQLERLIPLQNLQRSQFRYYAYSETLSIGDQHVYFEGEIIPNADPATYQVIHVTWNRTGNTYYGKDHHACYENKQQIECRLIPEYPLIH